MEVRKRADPVKERVKQFIAASADARVRDSASAVILSTVLRDLGAYYKKMGPRAGLSNEVAKSIEEQLDAAEQNLPEKKRKQIFGIDI